MTGPNDHDDPDDHDDHDDPNGPDVDAALRAGIDRIAGADPAIPLPLAEVAARVRRRRTNRRITAAALCAAVVVAGAVTVARPGGGQQLDTVGPAPIQTPSTRTSIVSSNTAPTTASTTIPTSTSTGVPATAASTSVVVPTTVPPTTSVAPTTLAPVLTRPAPTTAVEVPLVLAIDGFVGLPFTTPMDDALGVLRARFGPEDQDSGFVPGCGPGAENRWLRWGRLKVGFSRLDDGPAQMSNWQYPPASSPTEPALPATAGPHLTTATGLGPSMAPQPIADVLTAFQREFPTGIAFEPRLFQANVGEDVIYVVVASDDPAVATIASLSAEHQTLFNSRC